MGWHCQLTGRGHDLMARIQSSYPGLKHISHTGCSVIHWILGLVHFVNNTSRRVYILPSMEEGVFLADTDLLWCRHIKVDVALQRWCQVILADFDPVVWHGAYPAITGGAVAVNWIHDETIKGTTSRSAGHCLLISILDEWWARPNACLITRFSDLDACWVVDVEHCKVPSHWGPWQLAVKKTGTIKSPRHTKLL